MDFNIKNIKKFQEQLGAGTLNDLINEFLEKWQSFSMPGTIYEILSLRDGTEVFWQADGTYYLPKQSVGNIPAYALNRGIIESVKRRYDNEIFTLGDKCYDLSLKGSIIKIEVDNYGRCVIECDNESPTGNNWVRVITQIGKL